MACKSCGSGFNPPQIVVQNGDSMQNLFDSGNYIPVRYNGGNYTHTIGSPTGVIVKDGLRSYGRGKYGDTFLVHKDDISAQPQTFTILAKDTQEYSDALTKFGVVKSQPKVVEKKTSAKKEVEEVIEQSPAEDVTNAPTGDTGGKLLNKSEALLIGDFAHEYGFSHTLQVVGKIKSGELKSYKNDDGKTMVYHYDED